MKKILLFSLAYHPVIGGAEVAVKEITDRLAYRPRPLVWGETAPPEDLRDMEFDMITMRFDSAHNPKERVGNVLVHRVGNGASYWNKILFIPRAAFLAYRLNRKKKYDAFWALMTNMLFPIVLLRLMGNRTPYILTLQDGDPFERVFHRARIKLFLPLLRYGFKHAAVVQAISTFLAGWAERMGYGGVVKVVPNGADTARFLKASEPARLQKLLERFDKKEKDVFLVTTSRLVEKNGVADVIKALPKLPQRVKFLVIGVGPENENLKELAQNLEVIDRVKFLGFIPHADIPMYLHASDIFIRPSLSEGFGNSFIEAMAAGIPVIATPVGGIVDFVYDPDMNPEVLPTGLFAKVKNPDSIVRQVKRLMEDKDLCKEITTNGRRLAKEKYDWNLVAKHMKKAVFDKAVL